MSVHNKHFDERIDAGLPVLPEGVRMRHGGENGAGLRVGIAAARFNIRLTRSLVEGAVETLLAQGVSPADIEVVWVPGSFELPLALQRLAQSARFDALIPCGVVLEGATRHASLIMQALAQAWVRLALDLNCPVIDAVVSAHTPEQAEARCLGGDNRGRYAARAALEVATLFPASPSHTL